jgi:aspartate oxidase
LVIGGGLAGLNAALAASEASSRPRVAICDAGGCASTEVMGFCAPLAPGDSPELFAEDVLAAGRGANDPALARRLAEDAGGVVSFLERLGIEFDREADGSYALLRPLGSRFPRVVHSSTKTGCLAMERIRAALEARSGVEFRNARVVKLFKDGARISGALAFEDGRPLLIAAKSVVLAGGGAAGLFGFSTWSKSLRGDAYALALDAGASLRGMGFVQFEPCVAIHPEELRGFPIITTLLFEGARLIDAEGRDILAGRERLPSKRELVALMAKSKPRAHGGFLFDFSGVDDNAFQRKYPEYWKKLRLHLDEIEVKPAAHTTLGGVDVDEGCATSVPGLFAAGECMGGLHGADRIGGNAGLEVFVFGRIAGSSAAACAASGAGSLASPAPACEKLLSAFKPGSTEPSAFLKSLGAILDAKASFAKTPESLAEGISELKRLSDELARNPARDFESSSICARALAVADAILRD